MGSAGPSLSRKNAEISVAFSRPWPISFGYSDFRVKLHVGQRLRIASTLSLLKI
jgi:hypothetical protein